MDYWWHVYKYYILFYGAPQVLQSSSTVQRVPQDIIVIPGGAIGEKVDVIQSVIKLFAGTVIVVS